MSPKVGVDVEWSNSKDGSDVEDNKHEKAVGRLSATELLDQNVVPEHRVLFRVSLSLMNSFIAISSHPFY